jgi:hypothetical protein
MTAGRLKPSNPPLFEKLSIWNLSPSAEQVYRNSCSDQTCSRPWR